MTTRREFIQQGITLSVLAAWGKNVLSAAELPASPAYGGMIGVLVTPYHQDGSVDPDAMETLCRHVGQSGVEGVFLCGSTGDMPLLEWEEREALFRAGKKGLPEKTKIYGGVTSFSLPGTIANCRRAADAGVDVAVVMPPLFFFRYSPKEITAYMKRIADESPIPVLMYHHQKAPTPIAMETIVSMMDYPNLLGMKETGASIERTFEILQKRGKKRFLVLQGNEAYGPASFPAGADGMMGALIGVVPEIYVTLWKAFRENDETTFRKMHEQADQVCKVFQLMPRDDSFSYFGYTLKKMLQYRGWQENAWSRLPGFVPDPAFDARLIAFLDTLSKSIPCLTPHERKCS
ncbi:MAG: dihydrodipicolinate synthase family protein, partial [Planctomycetia bacterium]|nr:dihydrodipicolinate synthase family protein [Planctomycetia bacterium]